MKIRSEKIYHKDDIELSTAISGDINKLCDKYKKDLYIEISRTADTVVDVSDYEDDNVELSSGLIIVNEGTWRRVKEIMKHIDRLSVNDEIAMSMNEIVRIIESEY